MEEECISERDGEWENVKGEQSVNLPPRGQWNALK